MSDVRIAQTSVDSKQSQIESDDMLLVNGLNVRSQNKTILEDVNFKVKKELRLQSLVQMEAVRPLCLEHC